MRELWLFGKLELWLLCFGKQIVAGHTGNREKLDGRAQLEVGRVFVLQEAGDREVCHLSQHIVLPGCWKLMETTGA